MGTSTPELSNMLGTQYKRARRAAGPFQSRLNPTSYATADTRAMSSSRRAQVITKTGLFNSTATHRIARVLVYVDYSDYSPGGT